jgi:hypothetical protein
VFAPHALMHEHSTLALKGYDTPMKKPASSGLIFVAAKT